MTDQDFEDRPDRSDEYLISREALNEAYSALAGCLAINGDIANISLAMQKLCTAQGNFGDIYAGHEPQFVVAGWSEPPPANKYRL